MNATLTIGLMGAGKSKILIEDYRKQSRKKQALIAHISKETFSNGIIESRNGEKIDAIVLNKDDMAGSLELISQKLKQSYEVLYLDEVQFLDKETVVEVLKIASSSKVTIHFYGLLTTFTDEFFESTEYLKEVLPKENIKFIERTCETPGCSCTARHNARIVDGKICRSGETFIEQKSKYLALCTKCYYS